mmetsp:Transcript_10354/g.21204  ORF Transcript_10354/g.21204 Transcript_10354/m.21204 type:complete len:220 (-) Transcript_10354:562-1221(-)
MEERKATPCHWSTMSPRICFTWDSVLQHGPKVADISRMVSRPTPSGSFFSNRPSAKPRKASHLPSLQMPRSASNCSLEMQRERKGMGIFSTSRSLTEPPSSFRTSSMMSMNSASARGCLACHFSTMRSSSALETASRKVGERLRMCWSVTLSSLSRTSSEMPMIGRPLILSTLSSSSSLPACSMKITGSDLSTSMFTSGFPISVDIQFRSTRCPGGLSQ